MAGSDGGGTIGPVRTWALAAGGMVGGGIYIALGVVVEAAGSWAWLSFVAAGVVAACTAWSYGALTTTLHEGGGAFDFLENVDRRGLAGSLSWLLLIGYVLTISVYVYAFGNYVAHGLGLGPGVVRGLSILAGVGLAALNLAGAGKLTSVEVVVVSVNLLVLLVLAAIGLASWEPSALSAGIPERPPSHLLLGAAAIFVSYEGFQLLTYEYDEMREPRRWFTPVIVSAAIFVIAVYALVAVGATMPIGAATVVERGDVALSVAAEQLMGTTGLAVMTVAAAFATAAAINSTLFSTAKLSARVADDGELPGWFAHRNGAGVPDRAVLLVAGLATALALVGSLASLVEAASLVFLVTFLVVDVLALRLLDEGPRWVAGLGLVTGAVVGVVLVGRLAVQKPVTLAGLAVLVVAVLALRPRVTS